MSYYIGVIGSPFKKDKQIKSLVEIGIQEARSRKTDLQDVDFDDTVYIVSGLINKGVTKYAYQYADHMGYGKVGIDSGLARSYDSDFKDFVTKYVEGGFGSENEYFVKNIDILVVVNPREQDKAKRDLAYQKGIVVLEDFDKEVVNADREREG